MLQIRECRDDDWPKIWVFMEPIIRAGETYPYDCDMTEPDAKKMWLDIPQVAYIAEGDGGIALGTYYIKPNQPTLGAHVANCGYMVGPAARGRGVATAMCEHSQVEAVRLGFRAMQYNLVVKTNEAGVYLWQKLGFEIVGTLAGAFNHAKLGYVDAYIMYKSLVT